LVRQHGQERRNTGLIAGVVWLDQYPKKSQQTHRDFLNFIVRQSHPEFVLVNGFEVVDGLAAQSLWRIHAAHCTGASTPDEDAESFRLRQGCGQQSREIPSRAYSPDKDFMIK
jgi:hypothetical protein